MDIPDDLRYTKEHEWASIEGKIVTVGITDYAQDQLGDIVYVELPEEGATAKSDEPFGVVESVKAVSDIYAPVSGKVVEANHSLGDTPELLNEDPYNEAWLVKIEVASAKEFNALLSADEYREFLEEEKE
jgi:glycine cleavage system H protein